MMFNKVMKSNEKKIIKHDVELEIPFEKEEEKHVDKNDDYEDIILENNILKK